MQKVEGSNPFSRFEEGLHFQVVFVRAVGWCVCIVLRIDGESYRMRAHRAQPRAAASRLESMRAAQSANWLSSSRRLRSWAKRSRPSM
jgi:hypothetical protein